MKIPLLQIVQLLYLCFFSSYFLECSNLTIMLIKQKKKTLSLSQINICILNDVNPKGKNPKIHIKILNTTYKN